MRFFEIASPSITFSASSRFLRDLKPILETQPDLVKTLREFLTFRETAGPNDPFSSKDYAFTHLKGFRHVHLSHGRVILIYRIEGAVVQLCAIVDHAAYSSSAQSAVLAKYLTSLTAQSFSSFATAKPVKAEPALSPEAMEEARDILYSFASHPDDREILQRIVQGKSSPELWEMLHTVVSSGTDQEKTKAILAAFGGVEPFKSFVQDILRHTQS